MKFEGKMDARTRGVLLLGWVAAALFASGIAPVDRATWLLEVAPVLIGAPILIASEFTKPPQFVHHRGATRREHATRKYPYALA
jgi:hypothetical protein